MFRDKFGTASVIVAVVCLATLADSPGTARAQKGAPSPKARARRGHAKKGITNARLRPKADTESRTAADRIVLRDGKELLGQVVESSYDGRLTVLARREMVRQNLPDWVSKWENAAKDADLAAVQQRRERLAGWRRERPQASGVEDRITPWLDQELARSAAPVAASTLMAIRLNRDDVSAVEQRSDLAAQALRGGWLLELAHPETTPIATLMDLIAGRGMMVANDDPIALDRMLPPIAERAERWQLRRAATEVLNDDGLRFIGFGNNILPEPMPGRPLDLAAGVALVEGTVKNILGAGRTDSLNLNIGGLAARGRSLLPVPIGGQLPDLAAAVPLVEGAIRNSLEMARVDPLRLRLGAVADHGRAGMILTRIVLAADLATASAESTLYFYNGSNWDRALWRSQSLEVGSIPPIVMTMVAGDPQAKAVVNLIDSVGPGFVSPEMKDSGLAVGSTIAGAVVLARTALIRALTGLAFDVEDKAPARISKTAP